MFFFLMCFVFFPTYKILNEVSNNITFVADKLARIWSMFTSVYPRFPSCQSMCLLSAYISVVLLTLSFLLNVLCFSPNFQDVFE